MPFDRLEACIFDLDGVIVDTAKYHFLSWHALAKTFNYEFQLKDNEGLKGVSRMQSLETILALAGIEKNLEERQHLCTLKNSNYLKYIEDMSPDEILPGVIELIKSLRQVGVKIGLGSASKNATFILSKLDILSLFDAIVDGNQVIKGKPEPEVFQKAADLLSVRSKGCVVFEDAAKGIDAAKAAGMFAIGVGEIVNLPHADVVIPDFKQFTISHLADVSHLIVPLA